MSDPYIDDLGVRRDTHYVDTLGIVREHERKKTTSPSWVSTGHGSDRPLSHGEFSLLAGWAYVVGFFAVLLIILEVLGPFFYVALGAGVILGGWRLAVSPRTLRARMFLRDATVAVGGFFRAMVEEVRDRVGL